MAYYVCQDPDCKQLVVSKSMPEPMRWTDGHVCRFALDPEWDERDPVPVIPRNNEEG